MSGGLIYGYFRTVRLNQEVLPNPNGYELIRQAASQMTGGLEGGHDAQSSAELQELLEQNTGVLDLVRKGLATPTAVTVEFNPNWMGRHMAELNGIKRLGRVLAAEATLHRRQGETDQAVNSALELMRLGFAAGHRGLAIDFLVGMALETQALTLLTNMLPELDEGQCQRIVEAMERNFHQHESLDSMLDRERRWALGSIGLFPYLVTKFHPGSKSRLQRVHQNIVTNWQSRWRDGREIQIRIAARGFALANGRPPTSVTELVPAYLREVPVDPVLLEPLRLSAPSTGGKSKMR